MSHGPNDIIREYLEANATIPATAAFNTSWEEVSQGILEALEDEGYRAVHRDMVRTQDELLWALHTKIGAKHMAQHAALNIAAKQTRRSNP
jgi:hypothetical protein